MNRVVQQIAIAVLAGLTLGGGGYVVGKVFSNAETNAVQDEQIERQRCDFEQFTSEYRDDQLRIFDKLDAIIERLPAKGSQR